MWEAPPLTPIHPTLGLVRPTNLGVTRLQSRWQPELGSHQRLDLNEGLLLISYRLFAEFISLWQFVSSKPIREGKRDTVESQ